jgi:hypothetical protein
MGLKAEAREIEGATAMQTKERNNFIVMSVCFSVQAGCVQSMLQFLTSQLGDYMGGYGLGILYVSYSLSALFFAAPVVDGLGPKPALVASMLLYSLFVVAYWGALGLDTERDATLKWLMVIGGAAIGGFAAGVVWTAEGKYFSASADLFARASNQSVQHATAYFSGIFAFFYLALEVAMKLLASIPFDQIGGGVSTYPSSKSSKSDIQTLFSIYVSLCMLATVAMAVLVKPVQERSEERREERQEGKDGRQQKTERKQNSDNESAEVQGVGGRIEVEGGEAQWVESSEVIIGSAIILPTGGDVDRNSGAQPPSRQSTRRRCWQPRKLCSVCILLWRDPKLILVAPWGMSFGFSAAFFVFYVNGSIVRKGVGTAWIGSLTAVLAATAAVSSLVFAKIGSDRMCGKEPVMAFGSACFVAIGAVFVLTPASAFSSVHMLVPLYILQGNPTFWIALQCSISI